MIKTKLITEFGNKYSISEDGIVRNVSSNKTKTPYINNKGYLVISAHGFKAMLVHRLVAIYFIPNPDNKPEVNHKDCNPLNISIENLEWVTHKENWHHANSKGKINKTYFKDTKLSKSDIEEIRASNKTHSELSRIFSISRGYAGKVKRGEKPISYTNN